VLFVENIGNQLEKVNLIRVTHPLPNQVIISPLAITGEARGVWFFEANLPITLFDQNGNILVRHYAMATDEWMTENFVPFKGTLTFEVPEGITSGTLIIHKDNPSDIRELDDALEIPVRFEKNSKDGQPANSCIISGCNGEVCADEEMMSACWVLPEFACYKDYGVCERQQDGRCDWTLTHELRVCLNNAG